MEIRLLTRSEQVLPLGEFTSDTSVLSKREDTFTDSLVEYAARLCYNSTGRMGDSPTFIRKRIEEGHEDVLEHGWIALSFTKMDYGEFINTIYWKHVAPHLHMFTPAGYCDEVIVSGNIRAWIQLLRTGLAPNDEILRRIGGVAPKSFGEFGEFEKRNDFPYQRMTTGTTDLGATVTMLGSTRYTGRDGDNIRHATFLFEKVSRAFTHQLVRHRTGSFSQESQRYVESNGASCVIPRSKNPEAVRLFREHMESCTLLYKRLREMGELKEDARGVLPTMAATRIVMSGPHSMWRHFIWQRCHKSAQREIRLVADEVLKMLSMSSNSFDHEQRTFSKGKICE